MSAGSGPIVPTSLSGTTILIVDDDEELCELLGEFLGRRGARTESAHDGPKGLARALRGGNDLVLLDVMLPGLDGIEVLRQLRRHSAVPVILLTGRGGQMDKVTGLDAGADDYLPKPFGPEELAARVRAVLRRAGPGGPSSAPATIEVGGVRVEPGARAAWADGERLDLTTIEHDVLEYLARAAGRAVPRGELAAAVQQRTSSPFDRSLDVHVSRLRKKMGTRGERIATVRGVGYQFRTGD